MKIVAKEIEMIASFRRGGVIRPHRFRLCAEAGDAVGSDGERAVIHVDKIVQTEETRLAGTKSIIYTCQSVIGGILKQYEIKYRIDEHQWELYKM